MNGRSALEKLVSVFTKKYDYYGLYMATVQAPSSGDTVQVLPDDPRIRGVGGLQNVPVSYGLPDTKATIVPGAKVALFFENGDPTKPRASLFSGTALSLTLGGSGALPVARIGDVVTVTDPISGPLLGTIIAGATKTRAG